MTSQQDNEARGISTSLKLLLMLTLALVPIAGLLTWSAIAEVRQQQSSLQARAALTKDASVRAIDGLIARNALALRVAASGAFIAGTADPCGAAEQSLAITPALSQQFYIGDSEGRLICGADDIVPERVAQAPDYGSIDLWIDRDARGIMLRVGVASGSAGSLITTAEIVETLESIGSSVEGLSLSAEGRSLLVIGEGERGSSHNIAGDRLQARIDVPVSTVTTSDMLLIFLPVLLILVAIVLSWLLVYRLLIRPLKKLTRAVRDYDPDDHSLELPAELGPATEIRELASAFSTAVGRLEASEHEAAGALEGQRRLVREVHHRVKNNLQVVASLLSIHSRSATGKEAQAAYAGIGRRVEALAVVHRNHFAEVEESRGIQLRPLITELGSSLRASAENPAGSSPIDLDLTTASTTQDVAVAAAFLITEVVEYVLDHGEGQPIEIRLDRTSEITARLTIASDALAADDKDVDRVQFDRIVEGLARQLRSPLEKRFGRYAVELPIFAED
ncbi:sensor histidine kinase [Sphingomicrobium flavum]|uniref:sensor histidine kinase n=1 Tax=Sphingomicrobium flavum TaxID=1229164 RepID=UPI0021AE050F|nr:histidine kinase dimerization/phosphoacceptor domain -containing protein [Sphingomicrobium flavum]